MARIRQERDLLKHELGFYKSQFEALNRDRNNEAKKAQMREQVDGGSGLVAGRSNHAGVSQMQARIPPGYQQTDLAGTKGGAVSRREAAGAAGGTTSAIGGQSLGGSLVSASRSSSLSGSSGGVHEQPQHHNRLGFPSGAQPMQSQRFGSGSPTVDHSSPTQIIEHSNAATISASTAPAPAGGVGASTAPAPAGGVGATITPVSQPHQPSPGDGRSSTVTLAPAPGDAAGVVGPSRSATLAAQQLATLPHLGTYVTLGCFQH